MASEIKRYKIIPYNGHLEAAEDGCLVTHSDHLAAVGEMRKQIEALRAECREHRQMRVKEEKMWRTNTIENLMEATEEVLGEEP